MSDQVGDPHLIELGEYDDENGFSSVSIRRIPVEVVEWLSTDANVAEAVHRLSSESPEDRISQRMTSNRMSPEEQKRTRIGAALLAVFYEEDGMTPSFAEAVNQAVEEYDDLTPVVVGLTHVAAIGLAMAGAAVGTTPEDILGGLLGSRRADDSSEPPAESDF